MSRQVRLLWRAEQGVNRLGIGRRRQRVTEGAIGKALRQFRQNLQVFVGGGFRHQQNEDVTYWLVVWRLERYRRFGSREAADCPIEATDATMQNGDALPQPG